MTMKRRSKGRAQKGNRHIREKRVKNKRKSNNRMAARDMKVASANSILSSDGNIIEFPESSTLVKQGNLLSSRAWSIFAKVYLCDSKRREKIEGKPILLRLKTLIEVPISRDDHLLKQAIWEHNREDYYLFYKEVEHLTKLLVNCKCCPRHQHDKLYLDEGYCGVIEQFSTASYNVVFKDRYFKSPYGTGSYDGTFINDMEEQKWIGPRLREWRYCNSVDIKLDLENRFRRKCPDRPGYGKYLHPDSFRRDRFIRSGSMPFYGKRMDKMCLCRCRHFGRSLVRMLYPNTGTDLHLDEVED
jgi:hypothetical protein